MGNFETKRADAIRKKNEAYVKAAELGEQAVNLEQKRKDFNEGKSRIPSDLPEWLQEQIDAQFEAIGDQLDEQADQLDEELDDAQDTADEAIAEMQELGDDLGSKASSLLGAKDIPLVGSFLEAKGQQLSDQQEQMYDLAKEAQQYSDRLAESRRRLTNR